MSRAPFVLFSVVMVAMLATTTGYGAGGPTAGEPARAASGTKPIVIRSRTMEADNPAHKAVFTGDVVAETEGGVLHADEMQVFYSETTGRLVRIDSRGHVRMIREGRVIRAERAVYEEAGRRIVFTGEPRIMEGENMVTGSRILYYPDSDRLVVDDSRVYMEGR